MWRDYITSLEPSAKFSDPTTTDDVREAEGELGLRLPEYLVSLLLETNGVTGTQGLAVVWPLGRTVTDNLHFRTSFRDLYMPFEPLLFFADAGNGDQFFFPTTSSGVRDDVFVWDHENDSRTWYAASLKTYLDWWLTGKASV